MKDYLEKRREELRKQGGFTLMEMLIVIAIIAVLIAIAIPVFTTQLEKSREATDLANLRGAYAAGTTAAMTGFYGGTALDSTSSLQYKPGVDGSLAATGDPIGQGTATDGKMDLSAISGWSDYTNTTDAKGKAITVTFNNKMVDKVNFAS